MNFSFARFGCRRAVLEIRRLGRLRERATPTPRGWAVLVLAGALAWMGGCITRSAARAETKKAYEAGMEEAQKKQELKMVIVRGDVRQPVIPWSEGLTLTRALVAADYRGLTTPREIVVTRKGLPYSLRAKDLLSGLVEDPPLEPGDEIEVRR